MCLPTSAAFQPNGSAIHPFCSSCPVIYTWTYITHALSCASNVQARLELQRSTPLWTAFDLRLPARRIRLSVVHEESSVKVGLSSATRQCKAKLSWSLLSVHPAWDQQTHTDCPCYRGHPKPPPSTIIITITADTTNQRQQQTRAATSLPRH